MRTSVLAGILACALIFLGASAKAEAASIDLLTINSTEPALEQLLAASDTSQADVPTASTAPVVPVVNEYTVVENETLSEIAQKFNTTWKRLYDKNESIVSPDIISPGEKLVIPDTNEELTSRPLPIPEPVVVREVRKVEKSIKSDTIKVPAKAAPAKSAPAPVSSSGNKYVAGYCTWYVKNRRSDLPNNLGNANTWVSRASAQGLATGTTPAVGAVGQQGNHVVFVESVNGDGTVTVSEMNFKGWNVTSTRTVPASNFSYIY